MRHAEVNVCAYNGERIKVADVFRPTVNFGQKKHQLDILIVDRPGQPILGRDFMHKFDFRKI